MKNPIKKFFTRKNSHLTDKPPFDMEKVILWIEGTNSKGKTGKFPVRLSTLLEGILITGQPGSGKSSASSEVYLRAGFRNGFGALCNIVKPGDAQYIREIARQEGRLDDVVLFSEQSGLCFDPLLYEFSRTDRGGGAAANCTDLLTRLNGLIHPDSKGGEDEIFWKNALFRLGNRSIGLLDLAGETISIKNIRRLVVDAATNDNVFREYINLIQSLLQPNNSQEEEIEIIKKMMGLAQQSYVIKLLHQAANKENGNQQEKDQYQLLESYFLREFLFLAEKTKSGVLELLLGILEPFNFDTLDKCFTGRIDEELLPENTWEKGSIIILDFPTKSYGLIGRLAIGFYRFLWMMAIERRETDYSGNHRPVLLFQDEAAELIDPDYDTRFQATSRSSKVVTVTISQNIHSFIVAMGRNGGESKMKNLLGNLATKIFHAQSDFDTNRFASDMISEDKKDKTSKTEAGLTKSTTTSEEYVPQVRPIEFTRLRTGGQINNFEVECFVTKAGDAHEWGDSNFIKARFKQNPL